MVCSVSVLLPIPGSPPNKVILPCTIPPPSTRFSSSSCISIRGSSWAEISRSFMGWAAPSEARTPPNIVAAPPCLIVMPAFRAAWVPVSPAIRISLKVFHCPQLGHLPIHLADSCPQLLQTYAILSFAIICMLSKP